MHNSGHKSLQIPTDRRTNNIQNDVSQIFLNILKEQFKGKFTYPLQNFLREFLGGGG